MKLHGSEQEILAQLAGMFPDAPPMPAVKRKVLDYQMVALFGLAKAYNRPGGHILEIGTGHGGSGYMLSKGAPEAHIISLTIDAPGASSARALWQASGCRNIEIVMAMSWDYLKSARGSTWDMIFVDGDHNQIARDLPWFDRLRVGGLLVCHDYSPEDSPRPSPIVYATLNDMAEALGRPFDVELIDETKTGMVGFYRKRGERWQ